MPKYKTNADLPENVKESVPQHAQDIYRKTFNNAWSEYEDAGERRGDRTREETAHAVAWSAVKNSYEKQKGEWVKKD